MHSVVARCPVGCVLDVSWMAGCPCLRSVSRQGNPAKTRSGSASTGSDGMHDTGQLEDDGKREKSRQK